MEVIVILVPVIVAGLLMLVLIRRNRQKFSAKDKRYFAEQWQRIAAAMESDPKHAVLAADSLFGEALKRAGFSGTIGETLKQAGARFSDLDGIWRAHKLRNRIAHEVSFSVSAAHAEQTLREFRRAFRDLGLPL